MQTIGRIFGVLSLVLLIIGLFPFLGWVNWLGIPMAIVGLILSAVGKSYGGIAVCMIAIIVGLVRLAIGGGIF